MIGYTTNKQKRECRTITAMDPLDKETLRRCQVELVKQLVLPELLDQLFERDVFNEPMLDNIKVHARKSEQARKLLSDLPKRGPTAFGTFLDCLRVTEQEHIAELLETTRRSLDGTASLAQSHSMPNCAQQPTPAVHVPLRPQSETQLQTTLSDIYVIDRNNAASVLIISNHFCQEPVSNHGKLSMRKGTDKDEKALQDLFSQMPGFNTRIEHNIIGGKLLHMVTSHFNATSGSSSLILIIMTHGHDGGILFGDDGVPVNIKDIIDVMQQYKDKPKMIVIQACRGASPDKGLLTTDASEVDAQPPDMKEMEELTKTMEEMSVTAMSAVKRITELSDTFIFYSTVPGYASLRHVRNGTWFLQAFCSEVKRHYKATDFHTIATLINDAVSQHKSNTQIAQMPQFVSTLKKRWYLLGFWQ